VTNALENVVGAVECGVAAGSNVVESRRQQASRVIPVRGSRTVLR
jgi:hypothetical protein